MVADTRISHHLLIGKKTGVTDVVTVDSTVESMTFAGSNHLLYLPLGHSRRVERIRASYGHVEISESRLNRAQCSRKPFHLTDPKPLARTEYPTTPASRERRRACSCPDHRSSPHSLASPSRDSPAGCSTPPNAQSCSRLQYLYAKASVREAPPASAAAGREAAQMRCHVRCSDANMSMSLRCCMQHGLDGC